MINDIFLRGQCFRSQMQRASNDQFTGGHYFLVKDDFFKDLYFEWALHKVVGPVVEKVHFCLTSETPIRRIHW